MGAGRTRNTLLTRADPMWSLPPADASLPARCSTEGQDNADSRITNGDGEWAGGLVASTTRIAAKKLFSGKPAKVALARHIRYPNKAYPDAGRPGTKGATTLLMTLRFRPSR